MKSNWVEMTVGDVCSTISETYRGKDDKVVLINTSDVLDGRILNHQKVDNKNLKGQFKKTFKKNDILYSEIRPANKRFAFVDFEETDCYIASTKLMVLRPKANFVLPKFLFAFLSASHTLTQLQHLAETRSGTFPQITFSSELAPLHIFVPDFKTQENIVKILNSIDDKIELNNRINENLEQQLRVVFEKWFVSEAEDSWEEKRIGDFLRLDRGLSYKGKFLSENEGVPMLNLGNILPNSVFRPEKLKYYTGEYKRKVVVTPGDIIVANTDLTQAREVLGSAIRVPPLGYPEVICSHHISIVKDCTISKNFILGLLNTPAYRERVVGFATGTTVLALPSEALLNCTFKLPPNSLIEQYDDLAEAYYSEIEMLRQENKKLETIRESLLPRLMNGSIDVSEVM